jgi:Flp pilus assembly protein TadG
MRQRLRNDRGANLVEFAMVAPLLILLILGMVEFSWTLATHIDVKQGAREGARITAVNTPDTGNAGLAAEICSRMDLVGSDPGTAITWTGNDLDGNGQIEVGDGVTITVRTPHDTLTGIIDFFFAGITTLDSTVEIRIEQPADWGDGTWNCP